MRINPRAPFGPGAFLPAALLLLGALACAAPREDRVHLASRRDAEFADLSTQAGMVTPAYQHPLESGPAIRARLAQDAALDPQAIASNSSR